jgi:hypothetical protein
MRMTHAGHEAGFSKHFDLRFARRLLLYDLDCDRHLCTRLAFRPPVAL